MNKKPLFWETKALHEMSHDEWESVCDGCAKCCLTQLQDEETNERAFTDVACNLLDEGSCQCTDYQNRSHRIPTCITITRHNIEQIVAFAPDTCSYRLLFDGKPLPDWHHLITGNLNTVHASGNSVRHRIRFERDIDPDDIQDYIITWL